MGLAAAAIAKNFGAASVAATSRRSGKEELMKGSGVDKAGLAQSTNTASWLPWHDGCVLWSAGPRRTLSSRVCGVSSAPLLLQMAWILMCSPTRTYLIPPLFHRRCSSTMAPLPRRSWKPTLAASTRCNANAPSYCVRMIRASSQDACHTENLFSRGTACTDLSVPVSIKWQYVLATTFDAIMSGHGSDSECTASRGSSARCDTLRSLSWWHANHQSRSATLTSP